MPPWLVATASEQEGDSLPWCRAGSSLCWPRSCWSTAGVRGSHRFRASCVRSATSRCYVTLPKSGSPRLAILDGLERLHSCSWLLVYANLLIFATHLTIIIGDRPMHDFYKSAYQLTLSICAKGFENAWKPCAASHVPNPSLALRPTSQMRALRCVLRPEPEPCAASYVPNPSPALRPTSRTRALRCVLRPEPEPRAASYPQCLQCVVRLQAEPDVVGPGRRNAVGGEVELAETLVLLQRLSDQLRAVVGQAVHRQVERLQAVVRLQELSTKVLIHVTPITCI